MGYITFKYIGNTSDPRKRSLKFVLEVRPAPAIILDEFFREKRVPFHDDYELLELLTNMLVDKEFGPSRWGFTRFIKTEKGDQMVTFCYNPTSDSNAEEDIHLALGATYCGIASLLTEGIIMSQMIDIELSKMVAQGEISMRWVMEEYRQNGPQKHLLRGHDYGDVLLDGILSR